MSRQFQLDQIQRKATKRARGKLVLLNYQKIANELISEETLPEHEHKRIKTAETSNSGRMDFLTDYVESNLLG